jgi:protein-tyrosine phosphatase
MATPRSVLVICHANLCRSPYAAAVIRREVAASGLQMRVAAAGVVARSGASLSSPQPALEAAAAHGVDLATNRAQPVSRALLDGADLLVVMEPRHAAIVPAGSRTRSLVLGDLDPQAIRSRAIRDPMGGSLEDFEACYTRIDRCARALVDALGQRSIG